MAPSISTLRRNYPGLLQEIPDHARFRRIALERYNQAQRERRANSQRIRRANAREELRANARAVSCFVFEKLNLNPKILKKVFYECSKVRPIKYGN